MPSILTVGNVRFGPLVDLLSKGPVVPLAKRKTVTLRLTFKQNANANVEDGDTVTVNARLFVRFSRSNAQDW